MIKDVSTPHLALIQSRDMKSRHAAVLNYTCVLGTLGTLGTLGLYFNI